jgi:hypothetical protein
MSEVMRRLEPDCGEFDAPIHRVACRKTAVRNSIALIAVEGWQVPHSFLPLVGCRSS